MFRHPSGTGKASLGAWVLGITTALIVTGVAAQAQERVGTGTVTTEFELDSEPDSILRALYDLESNRDAKCHSTASRFESFVCGTNLSIESREVRFDLQKELVQKLWIAASRRAVDAGQPFVTAMHVQPLIDRVFTATELETTEQLVTFGTGLGVKVSPVRAEQYGSIAYALRAVLSVQQDFFVYGGEVPLTLESSGVDALREMLDTVTLSVLIEADRQARADSAPQITGAAMDAAWRRAVPADLSFDDEAPEAKRTQPASAELRASAADIVQQIIKKKVESYEKYNDITPRKRTVLMIRNMGKFYARYPMPPLARGQQRVMGVYDSAVTAFSRDLISDAAARAEKAGRPLINPGDAEEALEALLPQWTDDFEDIHVFTRLGEGERIKLEAYDCDSLRDFGFHWMWIRAALAGMPDVKQHLDPFAAEIVAEGISQYGVLLPRIAGEIARERQDSGQLEPHHLELAVAEIKRRSMSDHAAPPPPPADTKIVSTPAEVPVTGDVYFTDVTAASGVAYEHRSSNWLNDFRRKWTGDASKIDKGGLPTFSGSGIASEDIDNDGDMDLLLVGGAGAALMLNDGSGRFTDATAASGLNLTNPSDEISEARQPIIADFDNDGIQDVLVSLTNDNHRLFRGTGGARFEDVTESCGLGGADMIGGPATAFDFDNDGRLDVYIGYFGSYLTGATPTLVRNNTNALANRLFRNVGGMRFEDVTEGSGTAETGWTQAVSHVDFDRDGRQDLVVANDFGCNSFLRNMGDGTFENYATRYGVDLAYHSMNVGISDLNRDGFPEIYISNIATFIKDSKYALPHVNTPMSLNYKALGRMIVKEASMLYMSQSSNGQLQGYKPGDNIERGTMSIGWGWDAEFMDFDNDGDDDLYVLNGSNEYNVYFTTLQTIARAGDKPIHHYISHDREMNVFFVNQGGKLINRTAESGAGIRANSRSAVYLDFDHDGDLDVAVNNFHAPALVLRNNSEAHGNGWLTVRLVGDPRRKVNRDAIGARLILTGADGLQVTREIQGGSGYLSTHPKTQHFGVGDAKAANLTVFWPNGDTQQFTGLKPGNDYTIQIGDKRARRVQPGAAAARR